jgi:hypothetical protein
MREEIKIDSKRTEQIKRVKNFLYREPMEFDERLHTFGRFRIIFNFLFD